MKKTMTKYLAITMSLLLISSLFPLVATATTTSGSYVVAWGRGIEGQTNVPVGLKNVIDIETGCDHTLALKDDGTVVAWGFANNGMTDVPPWLTNVKAIAAGSLHSLALREDGTVVGWGYNSSGAATPPYGLNNVKAIAAGCEFSLALKEDGTVVVWGSNGNGELNVPEGLTHVKAIDAQNGHYALALKEDGTVVAWGHNDEGAINLPAGLSNVMAISAGQGHAAALKTDGTVVAWGQNDWGQSDVPAGLTNVKAIAAGGFFTMALKEDGTVVAWGNIDFQQNILPPGLANVIDISAGQYFATALVLDTSAPSWPNDTSLTSENVTQESLTLTWTAAVDDIDVTGYQIFQGSTLLGNVDDRTFTYDVNGLTAKTPYSFSVQAFDAAGNVSNTGPTVSINTLATLYVTNANPEGQNVEPSKWITIFFNKAILVGKSTAYDNISLKNTAGKTIPIAKIISGNNLTIIPKRTLAYNTEYIVIIPAQSVNDGTGNYLDDDYNFSFKTAQQSTKTIAPTNVSVTPIDASQLLINWDAVPGATSYNIYRSTTQKGKYSKIISVYGTNFTDQGLDASTTYWYYVKGVNSVGEGQASSKVFGTTKENGF